MCIPFSSRVSHNTSNSVSGTTWVQEIIWELYHGPDAADTRTESFEGKLFPWIDHKDAIDQINNMPPPRLFKTHFNGTFFRRQLEGKSPCPKIIYIMRNPKDNIVSYYHFHRLHEMHVACTKPELIATWDDFFKLYKKGQIRFGDIFDHVASWRKYFGHPRILFLSYEELKKDHKGSVKKIADFLDYKRTEEELDQIVQNTTFEAMKARPVHLYAEYMRIGEEKTDEKFFRKGQIGSWKGEISKEQSEYFDEMIKTKFTPLGIDCYWVADTNVFFLNHFLNMGCFFASVVTTERTTNWLWLNDAAKELLIFYAPKKYKHFIMNRHVSWRQIPHSNKCIC